MRSRGVTARKLKPQWQSKVPDSPAIEGIELPNPIGVSMKATKTAEKDSEAVRNAMGQEHSTSKNNGDNPTIADVSGFGGGKDVRSFGSSPKSNPTPAMPGA